MVYYSPHWIIYQKMTKNIYLLMFFTEKFLDDIKNNPKKAYSVLNDIVVDIENGKTNKVATLMKPYKDKIYMVNYLLLKGSRLSVDFRKFHFLFH